jgi:hypothetical protein
MVGQIDNSLAVVLGTLTFVIATDRLSGYQSAEATALRKE